jgi:hypothetical protein
MAIGCVLDCEDDCGWNRLSGQCVSRGEGGSETSAKEREDLLGNCPKTQISVILLTPPLWSAAALVTDDLAEAFFHATGQRLSQLGTELNKTEAPTGSGSAIGGGSGGGVGGGGGGGEYLRYRLYATVDPLHTEVAYCNIAAAIESGTLVLALAAVAGVDDPVLTQLSGCYWCDCDGQQQSTTASGTLNASAGTNTGKHGWVIWLVVVLVALLVAALCYGYTKWKRGHGMFLGGGRTTMSQLTLNPVHADASGGGNTGKYAEVGPPSLPGRLPPNSSVYAEVGGGGVVEIARVTNPAYLTPGGEPPTNSYELNFDGTNSLDPARPEGVERDGAVLTPTDSQPTIPTSDGPAASRGEGLVNSHYEMGVAASASAAPASASEVQGRATGLDNPLYDQTSEALPLEPVGTPLGTASQSDV